MPDDAGQLDDLRRCRDVVPGHVRSLLIEPAPPELVGPAAGIGAWHLVVEQHSTRTR